jgi:hypothetical protein
LATGDVGFDAADPVDVGEESAERDALWRIVAGLPCTVQFGEDGEDGVMGEFDESVRVAPRERAEGAVQTASAPNGRP